MSADLALLEPVTQAMAHDFLQRCAMQTIAVRVTQTLRTVAEQDALYAQGRTTPGKVVTHARGGESAHNFGAAFDICFRGPVPYPDDDALWARVGGIGEDAGLAWGGRWQPSLRDRPHFERSDWRALRQLNPSTPRTNNPNTPPEGAPSA